MSFVKLIDKWKIQNEFFKKNLYNDLIFAKQNSMYSPFKNQNSVSSVLL